MYMAINLISLLIFIRYVFSCFYNRIVYKKMINRQIINTFVAVKVSTYLFLIAMYSEILAI